MRERESGRDRWKEKSYDIKVEEKEARGLRKRYKTATGEEEEIQCSYTNHPK